MSWLIIVYLGVQGAPTAKIHEVSSEQCNTLAKQVYNNVKAGQVRAFCFEQRNMS